MELENILSDETPPEFLDESDFITLQEQYPKRPEYGYDSISTWRRGVDRCKVLLELGQLRTPEGRILEIACGDGMAGFLMQGYGHDVQLADMEDWRDERAKSLPLAICDVCTELPFESSSFDLVFSYNAFEHFPDPENALREMVRVCKPGGLLFFSFGPLYASAWGLHAYRMLRMPFPQFLFSMEFILHKLKKLGIRDLGKELTELQPMNRWRYEQFRQLWRSSGCDIVSESDYRDTNHMDIVLRYPQCFRGRGLTVDDLVINTILVTLRR